MKDRTLVALALTLTLVILGALIAPTTGGRVYFASDLGTQNLPLRKIYASHLAAGDCLTWSNRLFSGYLMHGEGQIGAYHPLHWLLYRFLPLPVAFNSELILSYPLMLLGMFLLLRRWELDDGPALFGALLFTFSGFNLLHFIHPNAVEVTAHLPWLLLSIDIALRSADPRKVALARFAITLLTTSQLLLGYPQYVWFSSLTELCYLLLRRPAGLRPLLGLGLAKALGILGGSLQLLPTHEAAALSTRAIPTTAFRHSFSLHPFNLIQLVAPYLMKGRVYGNYAHEFGLYNGTVTLALLAWLVVRRGQLTPNHRRLALGALILGGGALWLALGQYGGIYQIQARLPLIGMFRAPSRYLVLVHLAMAVGAAVAFADLARCQIQLEWRRCWPFGLLIAASLGAAAVALWPRAAHRIAAPWMVLSGPTLMLLSCGLLLGAARGRKALLGILLLVGVADVATYGLTYLWRYPPTMTLDELKKLTPPPAEATRHRLVGCSSALSLSGHRLADGYAGLFPRRVLDLELPVAKRLAQVGWAFDRGSWRPIPGPLPRVRLVARAQVSNDPGKDVTRIDVETTALVPTPLSLRNGPPGSARLRVDRPGHLDVETTAPSPRLLILSESYHTDWTARIGGKPVAVIPVYGDFIGCVVPGRKARVQFRFESRSLRLGKGLSFVGLLLALVWLIVALVAGRGTTPADASAPSDSAP